MRRLLLLVIGLSASLSAQVVTPTSCLYREGDDPAWSRPDYDDSQWQKEAPAARHPKLSEIPTTRTLWMRCRLSLRPSDGPPYLQIRSPHAWTAFLEGSKVGSEGDPGNGAVTNPMPSVPIPASKTLRSAPQLLAIRLTRGTRDVVVTSGSIAVGPLGALRLRRADAIELFLRPLWFSDLMAPFLLATGLLLLLLSGADPSRREILWWGILTAGFALVRGLDLIQALLLPSALLDLVLGFTVNASFCTAPWFFYSLRRRNVPRFYKGIALVTGVLSLPLLVAWFPGDAAFYFYVLTFRSVPFRSLQLLLFIVLWASALPAFWPWWKLRGQDLVIFPVVLLRVGTQCIFYLASFPVIGPQLGIPNSVVRQLQTAAILPATLALTVILGLRMRRIRSERDDLSSEMKDAAKVQQRLVPSRPPEVPCYRIDAAYVPAKEVGGDFYQCLPGADGSLLVVIGDVSGKGLNAAMLASASVVALGARISDNPSEVLTLLNRALIGKTQGGFVTCCCALFHPGGIVDIANAGHIPPYLDCQEVEVDAGPPLGIIPGATYETTTLEIRHALTFLSDGVLEATNAKGEMLGFERMAGLTAKSAPEIAAEAKAWGQEDDITVVQVAYA